MLNQPRHMRIGFLKEMAERDRTHAASLMFIGHAIVKTHNLMGYVEARPGMGKDFQGGLIRKSAERARHLMMCMLLRWCEEHHLPDPFLAHDVQTPSPATRKPSKPRKATAKRGKRQSSKRT